ncbi:MAG: hypothetical protein LBL70_03195, partial [Treponema sp.]|nr:hypothetical protein [Treponema sp.]
MFFPVKEAAVSLSMVYKRFIPVFLLVLLPLAAGAVTVTWDGSDNDGDWINGNNWVGNSPPNPGDDVVIPVGCSSYPAIIPSLTIDAGASSWGTLTLGSGVTLEIGVVTIKTGTVFNLNGDGVFKAGTVTIENGSGPAVNLNLSSNVSLNATAGVTVNTGAGLVFSGGGNSITAGSVTVDGGGSLNIDSAVLNVGSGGVASDGDIASSGGKIVVTGGNFSQTGGGISGSVTIVAEGPGGIDLQQCDTLTSEILTATSGEIRLTTVPLTAPLTATVPVVAVRSIFPPALSPPA